MSKSSDFLRKFEPGLVDKLQHAFQAKETVVDKQNGVGLYQEPFTHCVFSDFLADETFANDLYKEVKSKLKFAQKNNDLYKFKQVRRRNELTTQKSTK